MNRRRFVEALSALFLTANAGFPGKARALMDAASKATGEGEGRGSMLVPLPASTSGVGAPVMSLSGTWKFTPEPGGEFWKPDRTPRHGPAWRCPTSSRCSAFRL